jgi:hypothetical protein
VTFYNSKCFPIRPPCDSRVGGAAAAAALFSLLSALFSLLFSLQGGLRLKEGPQAGGGTELCSAFEVGVPAMPPLCTPPREGTASLDASMVTPPDAAADADPRAGARERNVTPYCHPYGDPPCRRERCEGA